MSELSTAIDIVGADDKLKVLIITVQEKGHFVQELVRYLEYELKASC